jgi:hypothetical protein
MRNGWIEDRQSHDDPAFGSLAKEYGSIGPISSRVLKCPLSQGGPREFDFDRKAASSLGEGKRRKRRPHGLWQEKRCLLEPYRKMFERRMVKLNHKDRI